jgi:DNA mismatch repair protein MutS
MGDFYELFDEDAQTASRELRITLTSREFGKGQRVPMAGIPHHALQSYLRRLVGRGYRVAISEQLSEPGRGLVERAVVRVVSPGTVAEPGLLLGHENNYLAALCEADERIGLAFVDVTTGEFALTELAGAARQAALSAELHRLQPAECLRSEASAELPYQGHLTPLAESQFDPLSGRETLCRQLGVRSLEGFGCAGRGLALGAAGAIVRFLERTNPALLASITELRSYDPGDYLLLDPATRRNLELTRTARTGSLDHSLLAAVDLTRTPMGGRLLRQMLGQPLRDRATLEARQDAIAELLGEPTARHQLGRALRLLGDLERLIGRVQQGSATARDLHNLKAGLERLPDLAEGLAGCRGDLLLSLRERLVPCGDVAATIEAGLATESGRLIRSGHSRELDLLGELVQSSRNWVANLERDERQRTGIRSLKVGFNKVFGYYLEVSNPNLGLVPEEYVRKQTLANAERFVTVRLKEMEARILSAEARLHELEQELFAQLLQAVAAQAQRLLMATRAVAELDLFAALADLADERGYCRPALSDEPRLSIEGGRHPVVEARLGAQEFVPNDIALGGPDGTLLLVTGPNMAGKSTYLRQVALICLLGQIGSFVPARRARLPLLDRIFTRIGAQDDLAVGASTFLVEMAETANILRHAGRSSLVILDEVGRGTSTHDGLAIAQAVVEDLHERVGALTLFATHYHELTELSGHLPNVRNLHASVAEHDQQLVFHYRIVPGASDRSYGIQVARLAGLPEPVVARARELLHQLQRVGRAAPTAGPPAPLDLAPPKRLAAAEPAAVYPAAEPAGQALLHQLLALDLLTTTPLAALSTLHRLQREARELAAGPPSRPASDPRT